MLFRSTLLDTQTNEKELKNLKKKYAISLDNQINEEELKNLKKKYTLGEVDFDSVIIANFGENLKSLTNSFSFSDVTAQDVKFITLNQWFDETLLKESQQIKYIFLLLIWLIILNLEKLTLKIIINIHYKFRFYHMTYWV